MLKQKPQKILFIGAALLFMNIIASCSGDGAKKQTIVSKVVKAAYMAANEGKYSEVEKYILRESLEAIKEAKDEVPNGLKEIWDIKTNNRTIKEIVIEAEDVQDQEAVVTIKIHYTDGETSEVDETLFQESGQWKLLF